MAQGSQQQHWKERAIARSVMITDAWEVTKTYAGRIAEWVLFLCMIMNIIEMLPGVDMPALLSNIVLGVQVVMLDVGGFSLASMGEQARARGDEKAATRAEVTGRFLIGLMILTLLLVAIGVLFPVTKPYVDMAESGLILVRVVMTVIYGHVLHSLRESHSTPVATPQQQEEIARLQENLQVALQSLASLQGKMQAMESDLQARVQAGLQALQGKMQADMQVRTDSLQGEIASPTGTKSQSAKPVLRALPRPTRKFDARSFVYECLQENERATLPEIARQARASRHEISESTICRYRKQYFASRESKQAMNE